MKTILITGASSGIGKACAEELSSENTRLILCSRNIEKLNILKDDLINKSAEVFIYDVDVKDNESVELMFKDIHDNNIMVDVLINNAGLALGLDNIEDGNTEDWDNMIDTNVKGILYMTKKFMQQLGRDNYGHIVNMGSIAGIYAYPKGTVYAATKSAVKFVSDGLRKEVAEKNVKVTNIQPGLVETNFSNIRFNGDTERARNVYDGIDALTANDIADLINYVISRPAHVQICEITVTPLHQASVDVIHRKIN